MPNLDEATALSRFAEVFAFRESLTPETDRGCVLMAAAYLDQSLLDLLRKYFVGDPKAAEEMTGHNGPLGSFSSRIDMAYLLGLIGPHARRDLHLIRKIRNDFGHDPRTLNLEDAAMKSRCAEMHHQPFVGELTSRELLLKVVMTLAATLHVTTICTNHRTVASDLEMDAEAKAEFTKGVLELVQRAMEVLTREPGSGNAAATPSA